MTLEYSSGTGASLSQASASATRPRTTRSTYVSRGVGNAAAVFVVTVLAFGIAGAAWGWWRPAVEGTLTEGGIDVTSGDHAEFMALASFTFATAVLGIALGLFAAWIARRAQGLTMMAWLGCCALLGGAIFIEGGRLTGDGRYSLDTAHMDLGANVAYVPAFSPGVALLVPLYFAWCGYWISALVRPAHGGGAGEADT